VAMTASVVAFREVIPLFFLGDDGAGNAATARLAAVLLFIGASFFVTDGVQGIAAGALRGLNDTRVPMWFAAVSFWLIGFTCAYGLAFPAGLGAVGIWIGFSIAVATFAALLVARFHVLTLSEHGPPTAKDR
jgi:MATE family, multidrug efflux pump